MLSHATTLDITEPQQLQVHHHHHHHTYINHHHHISHITNIKKRNHSTHINLHTPTHTGHHFHLPIIPMPLFPTTLVPIVQLRNPSSQNSRRPTLSLNSKNSKKKKKKKVLMCYSSLIYSS